MKTIAILLFSALALSACATDEQDIPDRLGNQHSTEIEPALDSAAEDWLQEQLAQPSHVDTTLDGDAGEWAEEVLLGDKLYTLIHGPRGEKQLLDALGQPVHCRPCERL